MMHHPTPAMQRALVAHPVDVAQLVSALHRRVHDSDSLIDLMSRACREAVRLLQDADYAGITAAFSSTPFTSAYTDPQVLVIDEGQYGEGDGPCLTAARTDKPVSMTLMQVRQRWPLLADIAESAGVQAFFASPLHVHEEIIGSLNLYSNRAEGLRVPHPDVLTVLIEYLERGLRDYASAQPGELQIWRLREAIVKREVTHKAIGILMARHRVDSSGARELLLSEAARRAVATDIIAAELIRHHENLRGL